MSRVEQLELGERLQLGLQRHALHHESLDVPFSVVEGYDRLIDGLTMGEFASRD